MAPQANSADASLRRPIGWNSRTGPSPFYERPTRPKRGSCTYRTFRENIVRATDKRARFVGLAAYEEAGGIVLRDLFSQNDEGWLQDVALLEKLVTEKLTAEAEAIKAEGWNWIEVAPDFPYGHTAGLRRVMLEALPIGVIAFPGSGISQNLADKARKMGIAV